MLKDKLIAAEEALKAVYESVKVQPGVGDAIDIALQPADLLGESGNFKAVEILTANGLQAYGYVFADTIPTLFLRNIQEVAPASTLPAPSESES
jgi:hypothetical protein